MTTQQLIATYTYTGDVIALLIGLSLLLIISMSLYYTEDIDFKYYKRALWLVSGACVANIAFAYVCENAPDQIYLIILFRELYHVFLMMALVIFVLYTRNLLSMNIHMRALVSHGIYFVTTICVVADILGPFLGYAFYYRDGLWVNNVAFNPFAVTYFCALTLMACMLIFSVNNMIKQLRKTLLLTGALALVILVSESLQASNSYTTITFILPMIVVFVMVHTKPYDMTTGALGPEAMESFLNHVTKRGYKMTYAAMQLKLDEHQRVPKELGNAIHSVWYRTFKNTSLFYIGRGVYLLAIRDDNYGDVRAGVQGMVDGEFQKYYSKFQIPFKILVMHDQKVVEGFDSLYRIVEAGFAQLSYGSVHFMTDKELEDVRKSQKILHQLVDIKNINDLNDPRVLAYCQPVYNMKTGRFDTAEVLMRMHLPEIGFVFPDEFIPLAERYGYIHSLSMIILNKACMAVHRLLREGYEFDRVSVNFAVSELHSASFCDEVLAIIERNEIPYEKIAIELTESQTDSDFQMVEERIKTLRMHGICFYLDDFGTGYSNFERLIRTKLDIIKFDRSLLLYGEKDDMVSYTLKHFSEAFHDLGFKVLFEGVENEDHEKLCEECKSDYLQGYKYSKPIPIAEYKEFLK